MAKNEDKPVITYIASEVDFMEIHPSDQGAVIVCFKTGGEVDPVIILQPLAVSSLETMLEKARNMFASLKPPQ